MFRSVDFRLRFAVTGITEVIFLPTKQKIEFTLYGLRWKSHLSYPSYRRACEAIPEKSLNQREHARLPHRGLFRHLRASFHKLGGLVC